MTLATFTAKPATGDGTAKHDYEAVTEAGTFLVRHEATTHAYPRGASNPRWFVYHGNGEVAVKQPGQWGTLARAKAAVQRYVDAAERA
jgi:hypothetical protein